MRFLAITIAVGFTATPELAGAQTKSKESPIAASRFGISITGPVRPDSWGATKNSTSQPAD